MFRAHPPITVDDYSRPFNSLSSFLWGIKTTRFSNYCRGCEKVIAFPAKNARSVRRINRFSFALIDVSGRFLCVDSTALRGGSSSYVRVKKSRSKFSDTLEACGRTMRRSVYKRNGPRTEHRRSVPSRVSLIDAWCT